MYLPDFLVIGVCASVVLSLAALCVGCMLLYKISTRDENNSEIIDDLTKLKSRPYVEPKQIVDLSGRITKSDNVLSSQGQILDQVKKVTLKNEQIIRDLEVQVNNIINKLSLK